MAILGRILQVIGWLWVAASFLDGFLDVPLPDLNFFPGLIVIFISRALRAQGARRKQPEGTAVETMTTPGTPVPRQLNTERLKEPKTSGGTAVKTAKTAPPKSQQPATSEVVWPKDQPAKTPERDDLIEQILVAGAGLQTEKSELSTLEPLHQGKPLTSDEMIARARQRWDRKP